MVSKWVRQRWHYVCARWTYYVKVMYILSKALGLRGVSSEIYYCLNLLCYIQSLGRMMVGGVLTVYLLVAVPLLEERDLVDLFGDKYRHYTTTTPMLLPFRLWTSPSLTEKDKSNWAPKIQLQEENSYNDNIAPKQLNDECIQFCCVFHVSLNTIHGQHFH